MTMLIVFKKEYDHPELGKFAVNQQEYVPRPLAQKLCQGDVAQPYSVWLKEQAAKAETAVSKVEPEKAIVEPVVEKVEIPEAPEVEETEDAENAEPETEPEAESQQCEGLTAADERCNATAKTGSKYCWRHEPKE